MIHRLFNKTPDKPDFPDALDLPANLTPHEKMAALGLLRLLVDSGEVEIYTAAGGIRPDWRYSWQVWLSERLAPPSGKRIPLREWAARAVCVDYHGGDAA
jgi:hypothetical protein